MPQSLHRKGSSLFRILHPVLVFKFIYNSVISSEIYFVIYLTFSSCCREMLVACCDLLHEKWDFFHFFLESVLVYYIFQGICSVHLSLQMYSFKVSFTCSFKNSLEVYSCKKNISILLKIFTASDIVYLWHLFYFLVTLFHRCVNFITLYQEQLTAFFDSLYYNFVFLFIDFCSYLYFLLPSTYFRYILLWTY